MNRVLCCCIVSTIGCTTLLAACMATVPRDFATSSIELIDADDIPYRERPSPNHFLRYPKSIRIGLVASVDLNQYTERREFWLGHKAYFCDAPSQILQDFILHRSGPEYTNIIARKRFHYEAEIRLRATANPSVGMPEYDLSQSPRDVCFRFIGGSETGFGFRSNSVRITRQQILYLLDRPEMPHPSLTNVPIGSP